MSVVAVVATNTNSTKRFCMVVMLFCVCVDVSQVACAQDDVDEGVRVCVTRCVFRHVCACVPRIRNLRGKKDMIGFYYRQYRISDSWAVILLNGRTIV